MTPKTIRLYVKEEKELKNRRYEFFPGVVLCNDHENEPWTGDGFQNPLLERFGFQIRYRRKKAKINPIDFAVNAGVGIETLLAIEYGYASFDDVYFCLPKISRALDIPVKTLKNFLFDLYNQSSKE